MFLESSRYYRLPEVETLTPTGQTVKAIRLRRLPPTPGEPYAVRDSDRLDILAQRHYNNSTWFWHIADANSELQANQLVHPPQRLINLPRQ
jgi:hypothetical protein